MNRREYVAQITSDLAKARKDGSSESLRRVAELELELQRFTQAPDKPMIEKAAR